MIINNSAGTKKDFTPDAFLDSDREFEARISGVIHVGQFEKDIWNDQGQKTGETKDEETCVIMLELTEEDTYVPRGPEGKEVLVPRVVPKFIKYSSHEKSNLFKIAGTANKKAAYIENKNGMIDVALMLDQPVSITFKAPTKDDKQYLDGITAIPEKYKGDVAPSVNPNFCYSVMSGAGEGTSIKDVPLWLIKYAHEKAVNAEQFGMLEEMEDCIEAAQQERDGKLEGDDKPAESNKAPAKKDEPAAKRTRGKKPEAVKLEDMSIEDLEAEYFKAGGTDDELNELNDTLSEDATNEDFKVLVIEALNAM